MTGCVRSTRRVFFYGLFMEMTLLREMGFTPENDVKAKLEHYQIRIGRRAGLIPEKNAVAYGVVAALSIEDLERLYSTPGVEAYRPMTITVKRMADNHDIETICYNLSKSEIGEPVNSTYSLELSQLVRRLGFPDSYAALIERCPTCS